MLATRSHGDTGKAAPRAARDPPRDRGYIIVCPFEFLREGLTPFSPAFFTLLLALLLKEEDSYSHSYTSHAPKQGEHSVHP